MRISVEDVERVGQEWRVPLAVTADDGTTTRLLHVFPVDAMEWRAAEYGIDPTDTATLLDIVLAEPYLTKDEWAVGHQLHTAPDIATARRDHLARCAAVKLRTRLSTRALGSPLGRVRAESFLDPDVIAVKAEYVAHIRGQLARERRAMSSSVDRAALLRKRLLPATKKPPTDVVER